MPVPVIKCSPVVQLNLTENNFNHIAYLFSYLHETIYEKTSYTQKSK